MKKIIYGFYLVLAMGLSLANVGCYAHLGGEGAGVGVVIEHDQRWHYDHDYDDNWRSRHAWHEERRDWDR